MLRRKTPLKHKSSSRSQVSRSVPSKVSTHTLRALSTASNGIPNPSSSQRVKVLLPTVATVQHITLRSTQDPVTTRRRRLSTDTSSNPSIPVSSMDELKKNNDDISKYRMKFSPTEQLPQQLPSFQSRLPKHAPIDQLEDDELELLQQRQRRVNLSSSTPRPMYSNGEPIPIYIPKPPPLLSPTELQLFKLKQAELIRQFQVTNPRYVSPDPYTFEEESKVANLFPVIRAYNRFPTINQIRHPDHKKFVWWWWWPEHHHKWLEMLEDYENLKRRPTIAFRAGQFAAELVNFSRDLAVRSRSFTWEFIRLFAEHGRFTSVMRNGWRALKAELKHYGHGFSRLFRNARVAVGYAVRRLQGKSLTRRERRHLIRTMADLLRLIPFVIIVAIPFLEFALPVLLKLFPNMLPSTFKDQEQEKDKQRQELRLRLELAEFLQDTVGQLTLETLGRRKDFYEREIDRIREDIDHSDVDDHIELQSMAAAADLDSDDVPRKLTSADGKLKNPAIYLNSVFERIINGLSVDNHDVTEVINMFKSQITLESMRRQELVALCRYMKLSIYGTDNQLRNRLRQRLADIRDDDILIEKEGVDTLNYEELVEACRDRGMRVQTDDTSEFYTDEKTLMRQLNSWIHLNVRLRLPTTLLILSRAVSILERKQIGEQESGVTIRIDNDMASVDPELREALDDRLDVLSKLSRVLDEQAEYEDLAKQEAKEKEEYEKRLREYQVIRKEREEQHIELLSKVGLTVEALAGFGLTTLHPPEDTRKVLVERYGPDFMTSPRPPEAVSQADAVLEQLSSLMDDDDKSMLRRIKTLRDEQSDHEELLEDVGILTEDDDEEDYKASAKKAAADKDSDQQDDGDGDGDGDGDDDTPSDDKATKTDEASSAAEASVPKKSTSDVEKSVPPPSRTTTATDTETGTTTTTAPPATAAVSKKTRDEAMDTHAAILSAAEGSMVSSAELSSREMVSSTEREKPRQPKSTPSDTTTASDVDEGSDLSSSEAIQNAIIRLLSEDERDSGSVSDVGRSKHLRNIFGSESEDHTSTESSSSEDMLILQFDDDDDILREDDDDDDGDATDTSSKAKRSKSSTDEEKDLQQAAADTTVKPSEIRPPVPTSEHPITQADLVQNIVEHMPGKLPDDDGRVTELIDTIIFAPTTADGMPTPLKPQQQGIDAKPHAPSPSTPDIKPPPKTTAEVIAATQPITTDQQIPLSPDEIIAKMMEQPIVTVVQTPEQLQAIRKAKKASQEIDEDDLSDDDITAALAGSKRGRKDDFVIIHAQESDFVKPEEDDDEDVGGDDDDDDIGDDEDHSETIVTATTLVSKMLDQLEHDIAEDIAEEAVQKRSEGKPQTTAPGQEADVSAQSQEQPVNKSDKDNSTPPAAPKA